MYQLRRGKAVLDMYQSRRVSGIRREGERY
jgi:hypothetical protein